MINPDGKIFVDGDKVIKAYPGHSKLPPSMAKLFANWKTATEKENEKRKQWNRENPNSKQKPMEPIPTSCVFQVCHAFNVVGGEHAIPNKRYPPNNRNPTVLDGMYYLGNVAELENYLTDRYGSPEILKSSGASTRASMEKSIAGRQGVIAFREGWAGAHTELWDRSRVLQNGAPVGDSKGAIGTMNQTWMWGRPTILFWQMVKPGPGPNALMPRWLPGWWRVADIAQVYYYYFYPNGDVSYTRNAPTYNFCPIAPKDNSGQVSFTAPTTFQITWNDGDYNVEQFSFIGPMAPTVLAGTYVGTAALPFVATRLFP